MKFISQIEIIPERACITAACRRLGVYISNVSIFSTLRSWLDKFPSLIPMTVYTYLRVIVDHTGQIFHSLRQREAEFIASLIREKVSSLFTR